MYNWFLYEAYDFNWGGGERGDSLRKSRPLASKSGKIGALCCQCWILARIFPHHNYEEEILIETILIMIS